MAQNTNRNRSRQYFFGVVLLLLLPASLVWADTVNVEVTGIDDPFLANVLGSLSIAQEHEGSWSEQRIRRLFRVGRTEARQALRPYGYYNAEIQPTLKSPTADGGVWQATYAITPGPPTQVEKLRLDIIGPGGSFPALKQVLQASKLHQGDQLRHADYKQTKSALSGAAYDAGFLDAHFTQSVIRVDPRSNTADIALVLDTGERYYFGKVDVEQDFLKPEFVHKFVPIKPGDPFDADRLVDLQLILSDTDYFSQVLIDARRGHVYRKLPIEPWFYDLLWPSQTRTGMLAQSGQLRVPVRVDAKPSKPHAYRFSAGYGTDTGPRVGMGVKFRHINEYGHQFRLDARISAVERTLDAAYEIPIANVVRDRLKFSGVASNQEFGDITSNFVRLGVMRDTGWALGRTRPYLRLQYEHYDLDDGTGSRDAWMFYPGYNWTLRWVDSDLHTRKGVSLNFDIRGTSEFMGSSVDFLRADLQGGLIWPMTEKTRLLLRGELGAITTDDFSDVPPSQRFFAGGGSSVRGYGYQEISPTNADGDDIGGRYLAVGSIETDYNFYKKFYLAAFVDSGAVANAIGDMDFKTGVGVGLRWESPVGMIRLDLAHPLDDPDTSVRIHFSIGPAL